MEYDYKTEKQDSVPILCTHFIPQNSRKRVPIFEGNSFFLQGRKVNLGLYINTHICVCLLIYLEIKYK